MIATPQLAPLVMANLRYWLAETEGWGSPELAGLVGERHNLLRAISYGLEEESSALLAAELAGRLFPLVERRGYWQEWIPVLEKAIMVAEDRPALALKLRNQLGFARRLNRELDWAIAVHQSVIDDAGRHDNRFELAEAHFHLANAYLERRDYGLAGEQGTIALNLYASLGLDQEARKEAAVLNLLGQVAQFRGDNDAAVSLFERSAGRWQQAGDPTYMARALINLGRALTAMADHPGALAAFDNALDVLAATGSELDKARAQLNLGVVYYQMEEWSLAEVAFRQANSAYLQGSGDLYLSAFVHNNLGSVLLKQGRPSEAAGLLGESIRLWKRVQDRLMLGNSQGAMAEALAAQGQTSEAAALFDQAIEQLAGFPDDAWARQRLAECRAQRKMLAG